MFSRRDKKEHHMTKTILIVEDDPKNLTLFRDLLTVAGYSTIEAIDGKQGVDLARARRPDLILMDFRMPVMDGLEATKILKADVTTRAIPIIAMTASAMKGDEERLLQAGFDGYISKPIDVNEFTAKIKGYLAE
jgi:two-component system cell cycle response regulator DivK